MASDPRDTGRHRSLISRSMSQCRWLIVPALLAVIFVTSSVLSRLPPTRWQLQTRLAAPTAASRRGPATSHPAAGDFLSAAAAGNLTTAASVSATQPAPCPRGPLLTVNGGGRLGNKLCQYFTLWSLHRARFPNTSVWIAPNMVKEFGLQFAGERSILGLPSRCRPKKLHPVATGDVERDLRAGRSVCIGGGVCDVAGFARHRSRLLVEFPWKPDLAAVAAARLQNVSRRHGCDATNCTYIGVHMRRTDYAVWLKSRISGQPVGTEYFQCALSLCRRRYPGAVFIVASDDPDWARSNILGEDVALAADLAPAGEMADRAGALDMATLTLCNHTVVSYGTFSYMAAFMAGGDIIAPTGYSANEHFVADSMMRAGWPVTLLHYRTCRQVPLDQRPSFTGLHLQIACDMGKL